MKRYVTPLLAYKVYELLSFDELPGFLESIAAFKELKLHNISWFMEEWKVLKNADWIAVNAIIMTPKS